MQVENPQGNKKNSKGKGRLRIGEEVWRDGLMESKNERRGMEHTRPAMAKRHKHTNIDDRHIRWQY